MATFEPNLPDINAPVNTFWARSIQQPRPSGTSSAIAEGIGRLAMGGVEAADFTNLQHIDNKVHNRMDEIVAGEMSSLDKVEQSIFNPDKEKLPNELGEGGAMDVLHEARANGKLSMTNYLMQRANLAKDLRSEYNNDPRYVDKIDAKIAQYTHQDPGNLVVRSRIQDLDSFITQKNDKNTWLRRQLVTSGVPNADQLLTGLDNGKVTPQEAEGAIAKFYSAKGQAEEAKWKHDATKMGDEDTERSAAQQIRRDTANMTTQAFDNVRLASGQKWQDVISDPKMTGAKWIEYDKQWQLYRGKQYAELFAKYTKMFPDVDPGVIAKNLNEGMAGIDAFHKHLRDDHGIAVATYEALKLGNDTMTQEIYKRHPELLILKDLPPAVGNVYAPQAREKLGDPEQWGRAFGMSVKTAGDSSPENTLQENQDAIDKSNLTKPQKDQQTRKNLEIPKGIPALIKQGDIESALNVANATFNDETHSIISRFPQEKPGSNEQGRTYVWRSLTSPDIAGAMWELKNQGHPEAWDKYAHFVQKGGQLMMQQDINDINKLHATTQFTEQGLRGTVTKERLADPSLKGTSVTWDTDKLRWIFKSNLEGTNNPYVPYYKAAVGRINNTLDAFKGVAEKNGADVQDYVIQSMLSMGIDPYHGFTLPEQMMKAIATANQPKPEPGTTK